MEREDSRIDYALEEKDGGAWRYIYCRCPRCDKLRVIGREKYSRAWGKSSKYLFPQVSCSCEALYLRSQQIAEALGPDWERYITAIKKMVDCPGQSSSE